MVKTTKKLLNFLQLLNKYVQKETKKRNLFIRRWLSFGKKWKPQRGRKATAPLHTPRAFFRSSWVVVCDTVLTFVCMLRCWMWNVVPRLFWVLGLWCGVRCWLLSVCFGIGCGTLCRGNCSGTVMRFSTCKARLRNSAVHVAYSRGPQPMRHMRPDLRNLYYATIYIL